MEQVLNDRHSDEIQEIITKVPSWIVRWGIVIFSAILLLMLSISAIIRYPDTIKLPLKIQTATNPAESYAIVEVTQANLIKIKTGQQVLIHLTVYSSDAYTAVTGVVNDIADSPDERGLFAVKIKLNSIGVKSPVKLKNWMTGNAEIITQDITVLQRVTKSLTKGINRD